MRAPLSESSAARALAALGHLFGFLVETGYLVANPFARIRRASDRAKGPKIDTTRSFRPTHLQMLVDAILEMRADPARQRARALLMLMESTGVRIGELQRTWADIVTMSADTKADGHRSSAKCLRVIGKGGKERLVPLKPSVLMALERHRADHLDLQESGLIKRCNPDGAPLISVLGIPS